jgi:hypothetical protein
MGLDITHDCWHGAYSGFAIFRETVGRAAGMPYYNGSLDIDWEQITEAQIAGDWADQPCVTRVGYDPPLTDPVLYLLIHSDCDGKLRCKYLKDLKARLEELVPKFNELTGGYHYCEGRLDQFIEGLDDAIKRGDDVEFH